MENKIDFVLMWVDGKDPKWLEEKNKYSEKKIPVDDAINRYRDMNLLKYWFRSVEKYTPWVNKIFFITWGHLPEWLDISNPKLVVVNHRDYIPQQYLPTFNANTIELNLHRIKNLSEQFVLFNDDMYILNPLSPEYFFKDGLPCDHWKENPLEIEKGEDNFFDHILINDQFLINKNFDKKEVYKNNLAKIFNIHYGRRNIRYLMLKRWKYFTGFECPHTANPYLKSSFTELWSKEEEYLNRTCLNKFRSILDVNQWVVNWYQMCQGKFSVKNQKYFGRYYNLEKDNSDLINYIRDSKADIVCINDTNKYLDFEKATAELQTVFSEKLNTQCTFEKQVDYE
ncbi:MAG: Stealth CR1 domain-containing protein [Erysipelotrichia bacterium]|nr:Stealth CR1 domain-containing protein [Erysipelotrichia bacterium]